jgi:hypothetical protein
VADIIIGRIGCNANSIKRYGIETAINLEYDPQYVPGRKEQSRMFIGTASAKTMRNVSMACLASWCFWASANAATAPPEPKVVGDATILVNRISGDGSCRISLRNDSDQDLVLSLSTTVNTTKPSDIRVQLEADKGQDLTKLQLKQHAVGGISVTVKNAWDTGDTEANLLDKDTKIGAIKIRLLPFTVNLNDPPPDKGVLSLLRGVETRMMLKSDDPVDYRLNWQLFLDGKVVCEGKDVPVDPNGYGRLICNSKNIDEGFWEQIRHLLKDEGLNGKLSIGLRDLAAYPPAKTFDLNVSAYVLSEDARHFLRYLITFGVLALGGLFSLFLNQTLPNRLLKLNLQDQLTALAKTIADLSSNVDSRLGVLVRIERNKLRAQLKSRSTVFPDFGAVAAQVGDALAKLTTRVKLLQQMDLIIGRLGKITPCGAPPSLVAQVNENLGTATVLLGKADFTDSDLQGAQTALNAASTIVDTLTQPGADFGQKLAQRIQAAAADIPNLALKPSFARLQAVVPGPVTDVKQAAGVGTTIPAALYESLDMALAKMLLMHDYSVLVEGTRDPDMLSRLGAREKDLAGYLQLGSWEALNSARLLMREMKGDIYPRRLRECLEGGEADIRLDPAVAYDGAPLTFSLAFRNRDVNEAAAREEWVCNWDFGDGLTGTGWESSHYYDLMLLAERRRHQEIVKIQAEQRDEKGNLPKAGKVSKPKVVQVTVKATFQDETGADVKKSDGSGLITITRNIIVTQSVSTKSWERTITEGLKLGAALLIAVFGLVAGAGDQLAKLDALPALVAIFLLGFGADTIKNVFSPKVS